MNAHRFYHEMAMSARGSLMHDIYAGDLYGLLRAQNVPSDPPSPSDVPPMPLPPARPDDVPESERPQPGKEINVPPREPETERPGTGPEITPRPDVPEMPQPGTGIEVPAPEGIQ